MLRDFKNKIKSLVTQVIPPYEHGASSFLRPEEILRNNIKIEPGWIVANLGCGNGHFTIPLARAAGNQGKVYAIDVLPGALNSVRSRARLEGLFNIETVRANVEARNDKIIESGIVDLALISNVFFQSSKKVDIIKEALRLLRPRGKLVIIEWNQKGSFGPPLALRVKEDDLKKMAISQGFMFIKSFTAGDYHYGMMFEE